MSFFFFELTRPVLRYHRAGGAGAGKEASGDGEVPESSVRGDRRSLRVQGKKGGLKKPQLNDNKM